MYRVALYFRLGDFILRQTPSEDGISADGRYRFFVNEPIKDPHFVVVVGKPHRQSLHFDVAPSNTVLAYYEPYSVVCYPENYRRQFGHVLSCQPEIKGANVQYAPPVIPWTCGVSFCHPPFKTNVGYKELAARTAPEKSRLLSVISSNKSFTRGHYERIRFVQALKQHFGDQLDLYGEGFRDFDDKLSVLEPYKYHIVIENSRSPYYFTEKFVDAMLAQTFPIYYGCTNLIDYFPKASVFPTIDINRPAEAIATIEASIARGDYEQHRSLLSELKAECMSSWSIFEVLARYLDTLNPEAPRERVEIKPCRSMSSWHNVWNYTVGRSYWKWRGTKI